MLSVPELPEPGHHRHCGQLYGAARALLLAGLAEDAPRPVVAIAPDIHAQSALESECRFFLGDRAEDLLLPFPGWETLPYDTASPHSEIVSQRLHALRTLQDRDHCLVITSAATLLQRLCPPDHLRRHSRVLHTGDTVEITSLRAMLADTGYSACPQVREPGEFAVRGAVVDVFPMGSEHPCRLDLFDDTIESIRTFDPEHQTTTGKVERIEILPRREFPLDPESIDRFRRRFRDSFGSLPTDSPVYRDISDALVPAGIESYLPLFFEDTACLFDYLPAQAVLVCWDDIHEAAARTLDSIEERYRHRRDSTERPPLPVSELYLDGEELEQHLSRHACLHARATKIEERAGYHNAQTEALPELRVRPQNQEPASALRRFLKRPRRVLFLASSPGRCDPLRERLSALSLSTREFGGWHEFCADDTPYGVAPGLLEDGFVLPGEGIAVVPETRLFPERVPQGRTRRRDPEEILSELSTLRPGTPVVHEDYGVGRYQGLKKLDIDGTEYEFMLLQYAENDRLYVPITELHLVNRYSGADPDQAPLHSLSGEQWKKVRRRAAERARDVAAELLEVQTRRAGQKGAKLPIPAEYAGFAQAFPFEETPDQEQAIADVLADLEADTPMDRIVCGDVGFGKTEVGMRAAFVAAFGGYQTAVLVPTTLLAQQHEKTFRDRFSHFPLRIEAISRFRSRAEQARLCAELEAGKIDILIGTHRLLQDDISFPRLGLVIVDEEQRFGVRHKERLKALRSRVNLLTLTATPIPRTLNMSLSGLRDLSLITTAPAHRHRIRTYVSRWDEEQLREACLREFQRGGQVFVVHNRIRDIEELAEAFAAMVPEAQIRIAHGRMRERELEAVMGAFYRQQFNLLVCTTIIESGIDIPTANTVIIHRADRFGLAQLHQLRGRVGRSHHLAYAYLVAPPPEQLGDDARKRIEAIEAMEELGAGFLLSTHDLEIRGAGELLGEEQSGQIQQVGFALYQRLLERAVRTLREGGMPQTDRPLEQGPEVVLGLPALIPDEYLPDIHMRLVLYKRIAGASGEGELEELQAEMTDRFGTLPEPVRVLFAATRLKLDIEPCGVRRIELHEEGGQVAFRQPGPDPEVLVRMVGEQPDAYRIDPHRMRLMITAPLPNLEDRLQIAAQLARTLGEVART